MNTFVFDIETGPLPEEKLKALMPEFEADKRLKDPVKIAEDLSSKKNAWIEGAALSAATGEVLLIGIIDPVGTVEFYEGNEKDIISKFWSFVTTTTNSLAGHCIKSFDIPFLMRRSWILELNLPPGLMEGRYLSKRFIDTMECWGCGNSRDTISLDNLSKALGIGSKNGKGGDFSKLYKTDKKAALEYCENDLKLTALAVKRMGL